MSEKRNHNQPSELIDWRRRTLAREKSPDDMSYEGDGKHDADSSLRASAGDARTLAAKDSPDDHDADLG